MEKGGHKEAAPVEEASPAPAEVPAEEPAERSSSDAPLASDS
jgi:hypothetical protein